MARPQKQGMDYFPHDTDASNDEKLEVLRALYGNDGYAFYFILLERIYRTADFELDVSDAETIQILAKKVEVTQEKFAEMLQTALKRRCFCPVCYVERKVLTSPGIKKRAQGVVQKRSKMAASYQQRQDKPANAGNEGVSAAETTPETPVSAEFPSREKESKVKESKEPTTPNAHEKPEAEATDSLESAGLPDPLPRAAIVVDYAVATIEIEKHRSHVVNARQAKERECMKLKISLDYYDLLTNAFFDKLLSDAERKVGIEFYRIKAHFDNWIRVQVNLGTESDYHPKHVPVRPLNTQFGRNGFSAQTPFTPSAHVYNELN